MILFAFSSEIQAGITKGAYEIVRNASGQLVSMARDKVTKKIVGHGVEYMVKESPVAPFLIPIQLVTGGVQMFQNHRGFQKTYNKLDNMDSKLDHIETDLQDFKVGTYGRLDVIQSSLGSLHNSMVVLQSTTALLGVGTVASVALSAVNLQQTFKLRDEVKQLRLEIKDGFIDMKEVFKNETREVIKIIDQIAKDAKFESHRLMLSLAYSRFQQALKDIQTALLIKDESTRNTKFAVIQGMLAGVLADYNNPNLLEPTSAATYLRRVECAWVIEQTIALTYQLQNEPAASSNCLAHLEDKIRKDSLTVIERCQSEEELDFLFPEIVRINTHDLAVLDSWKAHIDWMKEVSVSERQELLSSSLLDDIKHSQDREENAIVSQPSEQTIYENFKQKSHYQALRDVLQFIVKPELRRQHESYISKQAPTHNLNALAPYNWQEIPDLTVANLYHYFKAKEQKAA